MTTGNRQRCVLCERHQRLETVDGTAFWMEYDEAERPRLCMDSRSRGGGLNVLCVRFCPICGRACEIIIEEEDKIGQKAEYTDALQTERGGTGAEEVPGR